MNHASAILCSVFQVIVVIFYLTCWAMITLK